jgi:hypothetical protein
MFVEVGHEIEGEGVLGDDVDDRRQAEHAELAMGEHEADGSPDADRWLASCDHRIEAGAQKLDDERRHHGRCCGDQACAAPAHELQQQREYQSGQGKADGHAGLLQRKHHAEPLARHPRRQDMRRGGIDRPLCCTDEDHSDHRRCDHRQRVEGKPDRRHQERRLADAHRAQPHDRLGRRQRGDGGDAIDDGRENADKLGIDREVGGDRRHHDAERQHAERDHHLDGQHGGHRHDRAMHGLGLGDYRP